MLMSTPARNEHGSDDDMKQRRADAGAARFAGARAKLLRSAASRSSRHGLLPRQEVKDAALSMRLLIASDAHGDANATRLLRESYVLERPDLVVHLGDMVDGQTANASTALRELLAAAPGPRWLIEPRRGGAPRRDPADRRPAARQPRAPERRCHAYLDRRDWWSVAEPHRHCPLRLHPRAAAAVRAAAPRARRVSPAESGSLWLMLWQRGVAATFAGHDHLNRTAGAGAGDGSATGSLGGYGRDDGPARATRRDHRRLRPARVVDVTPASITTWARLAGGARTQERVLWRA